jgi:hypothetical protein
VTAANTEEQESIPMSTTIVPTDMIAVFTYGRGRHRAECSCGTEGPLRWWLSSAVIDALEHSRDTGCDIDDPLCVDITPFRVLDEPRRRSPWWFWTVTAGLIIGAALYLLSASPARADGIDDYAAASADTICAELTAHPYRDGQTKTEQLR